MHPRSSPISAGRDDLKLALAVEHLSLGSGILTEGNDSLSPIRLLPAEILCYCIYSNYLSSASSDIGRHPRYRYSYLGRTLDSGQSVDLRSCLPPMACTCLILADFVVVYHGDDKNL
jgi:hypothetical protein